MPLQLSHTSTCVVPFNTSSYTVPIVLCHVCIFVFLYGRSSADEASPNRWDQVCNGSWYGVSFLVYFRCRILHFKSLQIHMHFVADAHTRCYTDSGCLSTSLFLRIFYCCMHVSKLYKPMFILVQTPKQGCDDLECCRYFFNCWAANVGILAVKVFDYFHGFRYDRRSLLAIEPSPLGSVSVLLNSLYTLNWQVARYGWTCP